MQPDFEIWLDNQLSAAIAKRIKDELGYNAKSSYTLQCQEWSDWQIYKQAREQAQLVIILSKDGDFPKILEEHGIPPKLIKIDTGNIRNGPLWALLKPLLPRAIDMLLSTDTEIIYIINNAQNT